MKYDPLCGTTISEAATAMVKMANQLNEQVTADFNGIEIIANPGDNASTIVSYYHEESHKRHEARVNSPEGQVAKKTRMEAELLAAMAAAEGIKEFSVSDQNAWELWLKNNSDGGYGECIMRYAARWANLMEAKIAEGAKLEDIANETSHEADLEGITGFMYGAAVSVLASCWEHGDQLRRWHNLDTQIADEGERANEYGGVLNPALISIDVAP